MGLRNPKPDDRSFSRSPTDDELPAEQQGALPHSKDSERSASRKLLLADTAAVIANLEDNVAILPAQPDIHFSCLRVTSDICQRLLEDTENRCGPLLIDYDVILRQIQPALRTGASLELLCGPFDRGHKAQIVEDPRPQFCRDSAHT